MRATLEVSGFHRVKTNVYSYLNADSGLALQVQPILRGLRTVHEFVMRAATMTLREPDGPRTALLVLESRVSADKLEVAWRDALHALRPAIAGKLALLVLRPKLAMFSDEPQLRAIAGSLLQTSSNPPSALVLRRESSAISVLKVLVRAWLLGLEPQTKKHLGEVTGLSQPTIIHAVATLEDALRSTSDRSVGLARFPTRAWRQHTARLEVERASFSFVDTSGEPRAPEALIRRLKKLRLPGVALSGTIAASSWDPTFNLVGTPRLDLVVHAPDGLDLSFVKQLDPALVESASAGRPPQLVVHALQRSQPLFATPDESDLPLADPVEVLLDLQELGLLQPADDLIAHLRARHAGGTG